MPQITVEYSAELADLFDRREFALLLHKTAAPLINSDLDGFKTRFHPITESVIGDGAPDQAMVHVELAILSGRGQEVKRELADAAAELLDRHLRPAPGLRVQLTVEVRDMDRDIYRKQHNIG